MDLKLFVFGKSAVTALLLFLSGAFFSSAVLSEEVRVAVASNFLSSAKQLQKTFEAETAHHLTFITGSSGKLYAQIEQGAPFDVFLSADTEKPLRLIKRLTQKNNAEQQHFFIYAQGRLALLGTKAINQRTFKNKTIAMANPLLAPYGKAAESFLLKNVVDGSLKIIKGENVNQAFQFVHHGHADLALVAYSQVLMSGREDFVLIPAKEYPPIEQGAVLLNHGSNNSGAYAWVEFLQSEKAQLIIHKAGYERSVRKGMVN